MSEVLQRVLLTAAADRADGCIVVSAVIDPDAAMTAVNQLIAAGWVRAIPAVPDKPAWKVDHDGQHVALEITEAGRQEALRIGQGRRLGSMLLRMATVRSTRSRPV